MGLRIKTNVQSTYAQNNLSRNRKKQEQSLTKLSSGSRISKASDDAAGLAISEKLRSHIRGSQQAERNASDGISMIQIAEGSLNEISNILIRLRELSIQSASDTIGDNERQFSDMEYQNLIKEVRRITKSTEFNGRKLISGEAGEIDFQIGIMNNPESDRLRFDASKTNANPEFLGIEGLTVSNKESAQQSIEIMDKAMDSINGNRANLGALQNRLQSTIANLQFKIENLTEANSRIRDTDVAKETSELAKANILSAASTSVLSQANNSPTVALKLLV